MAPEIPDVLGWAEPDYALFLHEQSLDAALRAGRTNPDFWRHATLVADAKAWHISLDRPTRVGKSREYPPEQIEWYVNRSLCDYGILTNGRLWRLVPRILGPSKPRFQTYLEVDLPRLLESLLPTAGTTGTGARHTEVNLFLRFILFLAQSGSRRLKGANP